MRRNEPFAVAALVALLILVCGLRLRGLDHDLPYGIVSTSGSFITDEGGYSKASLLWVRHGRWTHPEDFNTFTHNVLYSAVTAAVFRLFGVGLETARLVSVVAFLASVAMLYALARGAGQPRIVALLACLAAGTTLSGVAFSRMAIVEPLGVAVSLAALVLWVRWPHRLVSCLASLLLGGCALYVKTSFVFTFVAVVLLWLGESVHRGRGGSRVWPMALSVALVVLLSFLAGWVIRRGWNEDWQSFQSKSVGKVTKTAGEPLEMLASELDSVRDKLLVSDYRVLMWSLVLAAAALSIQRRWLLVRRLLSRRATLAMLLWGGGGFVMFSLFRNSAPRYFYFLLFPLALLAVQAVGVLAGEKRWHLAAAVLVVLNCGAQLPNYSAWWERGASSSYADAGRQVAALLTEDADSPVVLLGLNSSFIALFDERILPIDSGYADDEELCRRIDRWRPGYLVHFASALPPLEETCPLVEAVEPMARYQVLGGYKYDSDMVVARLLTRDPPPRPTSGRTR